MSTSLAFRAATISRHVFGAGGPGLRNEGGNLGGGSAGEREFFLVGDGGSGDIGITEPLTPILGGAERRPHPVRNEPAFRSARAVRTNFLDNLPTSFTQAEVLL